MSTYCEKYGFMGKRRRDFLQLLDLTPADHVLAIQLQEQVITPSADAIVQRFYDYMLRLPGFVRVITRRKIDLATLKKNQHVYLLSLGVNFASEEYFETRLRVGIVHAWNNVPLDQYVGAFRILQQVIIDHIPRQHTTVTWQDDMRSYLLKILTLDMLLAMETYHEVQIKSLENTVRTLRHEEARLKTEVTVDQLTQLASRAHAMNVLAIHMEEAREKDRPLSLIMADLDHFKEVNDNYGHQIGDQVLVSIAARIKSCVRDIDTVGRYGGEEIIVILPHADPDMAQHIAERIRYKVADSPFSIDDFRINMTISQGLATAADGDTVDTLIQRADTALYSAKRTGRNRTVMEI